MAALKSIRHWVPKGSKHLLYINMTSAENVLPADNSYVVSVCETFPNSVELSQGADTPRQAQMVNVATKSKVRIRLSAPSLTSIRQCHKQTKSLHFGGAGL